MIDFLTDYGLIGAYILMAVALVSAIVLPLINAISNPKSLLLGLIGLVSLGIIFLIGYSISGSEATEAYATSGVGSGESKVIGGLLITMYILIGVAIIGIIFTEVSKILK